MPFQPVPNVVQVNVRGTFQGSQTENTFYYQYVGTMTQERLDDLTDAIDSAVRDNWLPLLSSGWTGREIYARDLSSEVGVQSTDITIGGLTGAVTGDTLPNYATIAIARRSGLTGRSARGRIFWQGLAESQTLNNSIVSTVAANIIDAIQEVDLAALALEFVPVIVSRYTAGTLRLEPLVLELAQWLITDLLLDTRRSRKPGNGD